MSAKRTITIACNAPECGRTFPTAAATVTVARNEAAAGGWSSVTLPPPRKAKKGELALIIDRCCFHATWLPAEPGKVTHDRQFRHGDPDDVTAAERKLIEVILRYKTQRSTVRLTWKRATAEANVGLREGEAAVQRLMQRGWVKLTTSSTLKWTGELTP